MAKKDEAKSQVENLRFYEQMRAVPKEAIKAILAGRLKGKSDVNPVWRIKAMTETFGPCGVGWKYEITKQWQEVYGQEVKAFTNINLYIKVDGEWSEPIPGTGGATLVEMSKSGAYVNDEGFKMSLTDAMSVSMKALGVAADVYFSSDASKSLYDTKYDQQSYVAQQPATQQSKQPAAQQSQQPAAQQSQQPQVTAEQVIAEIAAAKTEQELGAIYYKYSQWQRDANFTGALTARKDQLKENGKS